MRDEETCDISASGKMRVLLDLLRGAADEGSKVLLFSQSLVTLEVIERVLSAQGTRRGGARWMLGRDYFRLDGSTKTKTRQGWVDRYNNPDNVRARLFLISTRAGGLGINLTAASRVVIFDASWNPANDLQAR